MPPSSPKQFNLLRGINHPQNRLIRLQKKAQSRDKGPFINDQATWPIAPSELVIKSEKPSAFEVGLKSTLLDRMKLAVALFHTKIKNFQTTIFVPPVPPSLTSSFKQGNAPYAITQGVDIGLFGNVTKNFSLNANLLYNNAHFNKGFEVPCSIGRCPARRQLPFAPKWKATISGEFRADVTDRIQGLSAIRPDLFGRFPLFFVAGATDLGRSVSGRRAGRTAYRG